MIVKQPKRFDIPHEPGEWMELQKLSWRQAEVAKEAWLGSTYKKMKLMDKEMQAELRAQGKARATENPQQAADLRASYDLGVVLECGIVRWSYDAEVNKDNIDALDEETAEWAFREILGLDKPRTEEEVKNG